MDIDSFCGSYALTHYNGRKTLTQAAVHFNRDGDALNVIVTVANTLRGRVTYEDATLTGMLMSTMMMGDENQMAIEDGIVNGFGNGFAVRIENDRVLLKNDSTSFVFLKTMSLQNLIGEHAIISINGQAPAEDLTMKFLPDGNGGSFVIANVVNSIRGGCRVDGGILQGEVARTNKSADPQLLEIEEQITAGLQRGFNISKNDTGIELKANNGCEIQLYHIASRAEICGDYILKTYNGQRVETNQQSTVNIAADDANENQVNIYIVVANRLRGSATLEQNVLKTEEPLLSTRMMGDEQEAQLEAAYNTGLQYGLEVVYRTNEIILKDTDNEFVLSRVATVESVQGEPTYKGTYSGKCFKTQGNGLLFRIVNETEHRWAFYNDTKEYRMHVHATFGSRSDIRALGNARLEQDSEGRYVVEVAIEPLETEMFIEGEVNGFRIAYNAEPL